MSDLSDTDLVMSYHRVRMALGILGLLLPVLLLVGGAFSRVDLQPSLSDYYHTILRDVFVGTMFAIGVFFVSYKGYPKSREEFFSDDRMATLTGISAFGVALFPNEGLIISVDSISQMALGNNVAATCHYACALMFLLCLSYFSLIKFPRTINKKRKRVYQICGVLILGFTFLILVASVMKIWGTEAQGAMVDKYYLVFWFETVAIWAFAISWLVKGRAERMFSKRFRKQRKV